MKSVIRTALAAVVIAAAPQARAATELVQHTNTATNTCQGALANKDKLRNRPLGILNEADVDVFVSCSFTTARTSNAEDTSAIVEYFGAFFTNNKPYDQTVTCTGVEGLAGEPDIVYTNQSVTVLANGVPGTPDTGYIFFGRATASDPLLYQNVAMSCALPPGVSINDTYVGFYLNDDDAP